MPPSLTLSDRPRTAPTPSTTRPTPHNAPSASPRLLSLLPPLPPLPLLLLLVCACAALSACAKGPSSSTEGVGPSEAALPMPAEEEERLRVVLTRYTAVWGALTERSLTDAKAAAGGVTHAAQMALERAHTSLSEPLTITFTAAEHLRASATLKEARARFEVMSAAITRLGRASPAARAGLTLRYCAAAEGAQVTRLWAQPEGEPRNPYAPPQPHEPPCGLMAAW